MQFAHGQTVSIGNNVCVNGADIDSLTPDRHLPLQPGGVGPAAAIRAAFETQENVAGVSLLPLSLRGMSSSKAQMQSLSGLQSVRVTQAVPHCG